MAIPYLCQQKPSEEHWLPRFLTTAAKSLQSWPTLCDPIDGSPPGSPIPRILQARTLEWVGLPFPSPMHESEKWKWSCSVLSNSLQPHGLQPTRPLCPWDFPGKSTGVGCHRLLRDQEPGLITQNLFCRVLWMWRQDFHPCSEVTSVPHGVSRGLMESNTSLPSLSSQSGVSAGLAASLNSCMFSNDKEFYPYSGLSVEAD